MISCNQKLIILKAFLSIQYLQYASRSITQILYLKSLIFNFNKISIKTSDLWLTFESYCSSKHKYVMAINHNNRYKCLTLRGNPNCSKYMNKVLQIPSLRDLREDSENLVHYNEPWHQGYQVYERKKSGGEIWGYGIPGYLPLLFIRVS